MTNNISEHNEEEWRRLSFFSLLFSFIRLVRESFNFLLFTLAAVGIGGYWQQIIPVISFFALFNLVYSWLSWLRFDYHIGRSAIAIKSGIWARQHRVIPYERIQDVSIEQGLIARALDIAKVGLDTGAGNAEAMRNDGRLDSVVLEEAERLRTAIRDYRTARTERTEHTEHMAEQGGASEIESAAADRSRDTAASNAAPAAFAVAVPAAPAAPDDEDLLFTMKPRRLLCAGLFNFSLAALAIVAAAVKILNDIVSVNLFDPRNWFYWTRHFGLEEWLDTQRWPTAFAALVLLLAVGFVTGIVRIFVANWDFRLSLSTRAYRRIRGLTTRSDVAIPLRRVRAALIVTGWLRQRWGWYSLDLQSLANDGTRRGDHRILPFARLDEIDIALSPLPVRRPSLGALWQPTHIAQIALALIVAVVMAALGGLLLTPPVHGVLVFLHWDSALLGGMTLAQWGSAVLLVSAAIMSLTSPLVARRHRWTVSGEQLSIRRGWWVQCEVLLPFASVQSADLVSGPLLRHFDLVNLVLGVPGESPGESGLGVHNIRAISAEKAARLRAVIMAV